MNNLLANNPSVSIFGLDVTYYALVILCGILVAFAVIFLLFKRRNMSTDLLLTFFCICLPVAILTTRLFYCITDAVPFEDWFSWEGIRNGGLSIIGGILGGAVSVILVCVFKKINFFRVGDCVVVGLLLAQAIGRWGNYFNQEVYGAEITNPAMQWFPFGVEIDGEWHYAFFFYESLVNFLCAIALFCNAWFNDKKPNGVNTAIYFINYGVIRSIMEPLRDPHYILSAGGVPWSLVFSILLLVAGIGLLVYVLVNNKQKEGKFFGSKEGDQSGITRYIQDNKEEVAYFSKINMMCKKYPENYREKPKKSKEDEK
ncbi:MAG: prolipoprotein diacylglyceryl transferase [Clostridia bacterium]|nr:prolipoprotein diacylglyceryl transferase [Clostridia bacterium]